MQSQGPSGMGDTGAEGGQEGLARRASRCRGIRGPALPWSRVAAPVGDKGGDPSSGSWEQRPISPAGLFSLLTSGTHSTRGVGALCPLISHTGCCHLVITHNTFG